MSPYTAKPLASLLVHIIMIVSIRLEYTLDLGLGVFPPRKIGNCWKRNGRETTPEWQWKIFFCKKIAESKRSREHLALAHKLNENNESIAGTSNSDKTPKFIIEGCTTVDLKYV